MLIRWTTLCERVGSTKGATSGALLFICLDALYRCPPRQYHGLSHITACLQTFDTGISEAGDPYAVEFALWLHDAVYLAERTDNEARSAAVADVFARHLGCTDAFAARVGRLIRATSHQAAPAGPDERLIVDVDLSILGAARDEYLKYAAAIRREYAFADDVTYRRARADFLRSLLARPAIFATPTFQHAYEIVARENLAEELAVLT